MPKRRARRKRRHTVLRAVLATTLTLVIVTGMAVTFLFRQLSDNITGLDNVDEILGDRPDKITAADEPHDALNILLIGSDKEDGGKSRSDTTIILHLSANREFAYGVSLPRDAIVDRPDCRDSDLETIPGADEVMFNTAYSEGGPLCTQETVEELTGIYVDAVVEMDFGGFEDMVDAIGGVEVCLTEPIEESRYNKALPKSGTFTADGEEALIYVRERHQLSINGDIGRMKRQQAFLASLANKVVSAETLTSPTAVYDFLDATTRSMTITEEYASVGRLADLGLQFNGIGVDNIQFITVPNEEWEVDPNRLIWTEDADDLWELIRTDQPLSGEFLEGAITAEESGGSISTGDASGTPETSTTDDATTDPTDDGTEDEATDENPVEGLTPEDVARQNGLCS
ncbi:LCP family protein [Nocardioides zeae]|uniref:LCP family protein n=1 Tax=Nocardioides imazamoxiresistens TaxID=3231893 RepID=A0ABU3PXW0_9ACTN|nr:LCP family protein [Nocardioides zeae]MDT9594069.1 LCP family protein [Nocardioides zeae]